MQMKYALVLNAPSLDTQIKENLIIAADGGYQLVKDKTVQAVLGDFDTLGYTPDDIKTITYPTDKDKTDGEICLDYLKSIGASEVVIYGALGGKIDHVLGNLNLLAYANSIGLNASIVSANTEIYFVHATFHKKIEIGSTLSIIPFGGDVTFKHSKGLKYALKDLTISPLSSLGISNKVVDSVVEIEILSGKCLTIIRKN